MQDRKKKYGNFMSGKKLIWVLVSGHKVFESVSEEVIRIVLCPSSLDS